MSSLVEAHLQGLFIVEPQHVVEQLDGYAEPYSICERARPTKARLPSAILQPRVAGRAGRINFNCTMLLHRILRKREDAPVALAGLA